MEKKQLSCSDGHKPVRWMSNSLKPACPVCRKPIRVETE